VPEEVRATLYNVFRVPLNVIVVVVLANLGPLLGARRKRHCCALLLQCAAAPLWWQGCAASVGHELPYTLLCRVPAGQTNTECDMSHWGGNLQRATRPASRQHLGQLGLLYMRVPLGRGWALAPHLERYGMAPHLERSGLLSSAPPAHAHPRACSKPRRARFCEALLRAAFARWCNPGCMPGQGGCGGASARGGRGGRGRQWGRQRGARTSTVEHSRRPLLVSAVAPCAALLV
jgi:hypothetical protein